MLFFKKAQGPAPTTFLERLTDQLLPEKTIELVRFISAGWDFEGRLLCAVALAAQWRVFMQRFGDAHGFATAAVPLRHDYIEGLSALVFDAEADYQRAKANGSHQLARECLATKLSAMFLCDYAITVALGRESYRQRLGKELDELITIGWTASSQANPGEAERDAAYVSFTAA